MFRYATESDLLLSAKAKTLLKRGIEHDQIYGNSNQIIGYKRRQEERIGLIRRSEKPGHVDQVPLRRKSIQDRLGRESKSRLNARYKNKKGTPRTAENTVRKLEEKKRKKLRKKARYLRNKTDRKRREESNTGQAETVEQCIKNCESKTAEFYPKTREHCVGEPETEAESESKTEEHCVEEPDTGAELEPKTEEQNSEKGELDVQAHTSSGER